MVRNIAGNKARIKHLATEGLRKLRLGELREARGITQQRIAENLGVTKSAVCQIESREHIGLEVLMRYVLATGGKLEIKAVYPDGDWNMTP